MNEGMYVQYLFEGLQRIGREEKREATLSIPSLFLYIILVVTPYQAPYHH